MHPGIEIRITTPAGIVIQCDSDFAHYSTIFRGTPVGEWITLLRHFDGSAVLDEGDARFAAAPELPQLPPTLTFEIRAVELEDTDVPDDARQLMHDAVDAGLWPDVQAAEPGDDDAAAGGVRGGDVGGPGGDR
jgi:hypothetical protein